MSFDVDPSAGSGPFLFTWNCENKQLINGVDFDLIATYSSLFNTCPTALLSSNRLPQLENGLMADDEQVISFSMPANVCRSVGIFVVRVSDSSVVDSRTVNFNNFS